MPVSSAVYQPTTVTYELASELTNDQNQGETTRFFRSFRSKSNQNAFLSENFWDNFFSGGQRARHKFFNFNLCLGLSILAIGAILFLCGFIDYDESIEYDINNTNLERSYDIISIIFGLIFTVVGIIILGLYIRNLPRTKISSSSIKTPLTSSNNVTIRMNSSTGFDSNVEYVPNNSNILYQKASTVDDNSEISQLMAQELKESLNHDKENGLAVDEKLDLKQSC